MILQLSFRRAISADAEDISLLINSAYRGDSARAGWTNEADLVDGLRTTVEEVKTLIHSAEDFFLLSFSNDSLMACVHVKESMSEYSFGMISVEPQSQNQKIGARLLDALEQEAKRQKKTMIRLDVIHLRKELIAYYERRGFSLTGKEVDFPPEYPAKIKGLKLLEMRKTL